MVTSHVLITSEENTVFFHCVSKSGELTGSQKQFCAGVAEWLIQEITGGEQALNAKYVKLKPFQVLEMKANRCVIF